MTSITLHRKDLRPFETVSGRVTWQLESIPPDLELRLFWHTRGRGMTDSGTVAKLKLDPAAAGARDFTFELPAGPWSLNGTLVAIVWGIELVDGESGGLGCEEFTVSPDRRERTLTRVEAPRSEHHRKLPFVSRPSHPADERP